VAFLTYLVYVSTPISYLTNIKYIFSSITPSAQRLKQLFEAEKEIYNQKKVIQSLNANSTIEFKGVSYSYSDNKIIDNLDVIFKLGQVVAIVGDNGSGKTTIGNLLMRFIEPDEGIILLNDVDIKEIDLNLYRDMFAVADMKSHLFQEKLIYNINIKDKKLENFKDIIKRSQLEDSEHVLNRSELKLHEANVSSGERQKIIIARTLLADKPISIFDEATANLDKKSKRSIENSIGKSSERTLNIIITHSKDILQYVDTIVMIHSGKAKCFDNFKEAINDKEFNKLFVNDYV